MFSSSQFHSDFATWIISTHEIGITGLNLTRSLSTDALSALIKEPHDDLFSWELLEATQAKFIISQENAQVFKVHIKSPLVLKCSCVRCLEPVNYNLDINFVITMMQGSELSADEIPGDYSFDSDCEDSQEHAVGYFFGNTIDLGLILREQIFLEVPDYPECQATCKQADALLSTQMSTRENPFVKFWKN
jgi:uncharacterized metal-binding protein YceD (DUF177 family)